MNNKVILCPGHTEKRQGAESPHFPGITEHKQAMLLCRLVAEKRKNVSVHAGSLKDKVALINRRMPLLAIDLHFNADNDHTDPQDRDDSKGKGTMVMYCPGNAERRRQAATCSDMLSRGLGTVDHGAREGWYWGGDNPGQVPDYFLKHTAVPAFILEPTYIDNEYETKYWIMSGRQKQYADVIIDAIDDLVRRVGQHV